MGMKRYVLISVAVVVAVAGCKKGASESKPSAAKEAAVGPKCSALAAAPEADGLAYDQLVTAVYEKGADAEAVRHAMTASQQALWATHELEDEVNNGGFNQYFFNSSGAHIDQAVAGYALFSAAEHQQLAIKAREINAKDKTRLEAARGEGTLEAFSDSYENDPYKGLDDIFFKLDVPASRAAYVKAHPREFCVP